MDCHNGNDIQSMQRMLGKRPVPIGMPPEMLLIIKVLSMQIPVVWENIKYAVSKTAEVDEENLQAYFNELAHSLLNDKSQCFVRLDDDRNLLMLAITKIIVDKFSGKKKLHIQCLYSFKLVEDETWKADMEFLRKFAKDRKCSYITFDSRNKRIWNLGEILGFREKHRHFIYKMGG